MLKTFIITSVLMDPNDNLASLAFERSLESTIEQTISNFCENSNPQLEEVERTVSTSVCSTGEFRNSIFTVTTVTSRFRKCKTRSEKEKSDERQYPATNAMTSKKHKKLENSECGNSSDSLDDAFNLAEKNSAMQEAKEIIEDLEKLLDL